MVSLGRADAANEIVCRTRRGSLELPDNAKSYLAPSWLNPVQCPACLLLDMVGPPFPIRESELKEYKGETEWSKNGYDLSLR